MSLKPVFNATSETEATIIRNLLQSAGIESDISTDDGGGMLQSLAFTDGVAVMVDEKDFGEAMAVLDGYRKGETALAEDEDVPG